MFFISQFVTNEFRDKNWNVAICRLYARSQNSRGYFNNTQLDAPSRRELAWKRLATGPLGEIICARLTPNLGRVPATFTGPKTLARNGARCRKNGLKCRSAPHHGDLSTGFYAQFAIDRIVDSVKIDHSPD